MRSEIKENVVLPLLNILRFAGHDKLVEEEMSKVSATTNSDRYLDNEGIEIDNVIDILTASLKNCEPSLNIELETLSQIMNNGQNLDMNKVRTGYTP